jgi:uroporphyrinogen-III decarboxylase
MNGGERVLAFIDHRTVAHIPLMPITMKFAGDQMGVKYDSYVRDYRVLVETQLFTAEKFDIDQVSCVSDPARRAADLGTTVRSFSDQPSCRFTWEQSPGRRLKCFGKIPTGLKFLFRFER